VKISLSNGINAYAATVGTPLADTSDVNATWLGRIVHKITAPKINMTVTAFLG
jgi:hypothetical protein